MEGAPVSRKWEPLKGWKQASTSARNQLPIAQTGSESRFWSMSPGTQSLFPSPHQGTCHPPEKPELCMFTSDAPALLLSCMNMFIFPFTNGNSSLLLFSLWICNDDYHLWNMSKKTSIYCANSHKTLTDCNVVHWYTFIN